ncbi:GFA family protein [Seongchinamella unica]|uniref:GFA family protein n=1 Tax=Seongchinamella unica TaxID=2547392 RepID=A0A4R5LW30_9GAMM|nr:GFA family protein [Seongchinamella unica]TDG15642.1 GFA family protein [Seongchinamella unica]
MEQQFHGECLCGKVRFHYSGASLWCAHCHCTLCQRAHGAAVVTWVGVTEAAFHLDAAADLLWYDSSEQAQRGFCGNCGSSLFFRSQRWPREVHIALAAMTDAIDRQPAAHVFWDAHVDWLSFNDALPKTEGSGDG